MQIEANRVVTLNYTLTDNDNNVIDQSDDGSFCYLHGASNIIPGLENALSGKNAGDELSVKVSPAEGYGEHDASRVQEVPREMFPDDTDIQPGMQFHAQSPEGQAIAVTISKVEGDMITVDGNHPLAGVELNFVVRIVDIREATDEEKQHGHVHGPGGHEHG